MRPGVVPPGLRKAAHEHWTAGRLAQATAAYREIARLEPSNAEAHTDLGAALAAGGHLTEAVDSLQRALRSRPSLQTALQNLGHALELLGREREAAAAFRRLARLIRDPLERRLLLGAALTLEGAAAEAEVELRRALASAPEHPRANALLGRLLLERGAFEEAERCLVKALDEAPDAFQQLAIARKMTNADLPLLARMSARLAQGDLTPVQRCNVHFGLGKAYDDTADYARAIENYDQANGLRYASGRLDRDGLVSTYDHLISRYTAAALEVAGSRDEDPDEDVPVLIVGMPRSGTTLVEQILSSHPAVAAGGELSFWSDCVRQWREVDRASPAASARPTINAQALAQAAHGYQALLRKTGPRAMRVTDKAPTNFERLGLIRTALPRIRIIHCRRQPIDNGLSIFFTNYQGRQAWSRADVVFQYRQHQRLMAHWRSVMTPARFIEVDYEALVADREAQTRRLIAFCGLDWDDACLAPEQNRRVVRTSSVWQARQATYSGSIDRWRHYEPWLGELRELLPDPA